MLRRRDDRGGLGGARVPPLATVATETLVGELATRCEALTLTMEMRGELDQSECLFISAGNASTCIGMLARFQADMLRDDADADADKGTW